MKLEPNARRFEGLTGTKPSPLRAVDVDSPEEHVFVVCSCSGYQARQQVAPQTGNSLPTAGQV